MTTNQSHTGVIPQVEVPQAQVVPQQDSHTGATIQHQSVDNSHTGVTPQIGANFHRASTSHTGVTPIQNYVNNSHTGVMTLVENNLSHTGVAPQQNYVNNPHTGVMSLVGNNPHTGSIPQQVVNPHIGTTPQAGAIPHIEGAAKPDPLSTSEIASLLDGLPPTGSDINWLYLGDGTWTIPTQYLAWIKELKSKEGGTPIFQFEVTYNYVGKHPHGIPSYVESAGHPEPSNLILKYSHKGEWVKIPRNRWDSSGPNYTDFHVGRLERYLDNKGNLKMAVAYGRSTDVLRTWFHYEELREYLGNWVLPEIPYWYNNPIVITEKVRKEHETKKVNGNTNQNTNQSKKKENTRQNNTQEEVKTPVENGRSNNFSGPAKPQRPRKDRSRDSRDSNKAFEHRRDSSGDR